MINLNKIYQWSRTNLFSNWYNTIVSLIIIFAFLKIIPPLLNWLFFDATFKGSSAKECYGDGACWIFIKVWFEKFIYGLYPNDQIWRINLAFLILIFSVISTIFVNPKIKRYIIIFLIFVFPFIGIWLMGGFVIDIESLDIYVPILEEVDTRVWGGLSLSFRKKIKSSSN